MSISISSLTLSLRRRASSSELKSWDARLKLYSRARVHCLRLTCRIICPCVLSWNHTPISPQTSNLKPSTLIHIITATFLSKLQVWSLLRYRRQAKTSKNKGRTIIESIENNRVAIYLTVTSFSQEISDFCCCEWVAVGALSQQPVMAMGMLCSAACSTMNMECWMQAPPGPCDPDKQQFITNM